MKPILLALLLAGAAMAAPLEVTGSGTHIFGPGMTDFNVSFTGGITGSCSGTGLGACNLAGGSGFGLTIDGQNFSPGFYTVFFGFGLGNAVGYNQQLQPVVNEQTISYVHVTSEVCTDDNSRNRICTDQFVLTPFEPAAVPEPSTWLLTAAGLLAAIIMKTQRSHRWTVPSME